jgi:heterodisulfide reductase subunit B2
MKIGYYPGCSLHATAREYEESLRAIAGKLDLELVEIDDWNCCGATSAHATNHLLSVALPARNLALAEEQSLSAVMAPCAACYSRLASARSAIASDAALAETVRQTVSRPGFKNTVKIQSVVEVLRDLAPHIKEKATPAAKGLKVACYYGCLLVRPPEITGWDDPEDPSSMENIVRALGAEPVKWRRRLDCCGAGFSLSRVSSVVRLGREILMDAKEAGAQAVVVACPMCHSNLDFRQLVIARKTQMAFDLPILFLTQLVGLGLGLAHEQLGLDRHFISTESVTHRPAAEAAAATPKTAEAAN